MVVVGAAVGGVAHARVDVVTNAVVVGIGRTCSAADAEGVQLVSVAVAIAFRDICASAFVDVAGPVADAARVVGPHALVNVVADAVGIVIGRAGSATHTEDVELVSVAVAIAFRDVGASTFVDVAGPVADAARVVRSYAIVDVVADAVGVRIFSTVSTAHANGVELVSVAVAIAFRDIGASAFVDVAGPVAEAASVVSSHARVDVVTNAVGIGV